VCVCVCVRVPVPVPVYVLGGVVTRREGCGATSRGMHMAYGGGAQARRMRGVVTWRQGRVAAKDPASGHHLHGGRRGGGGAHRVVRARRDMGVRGGVVPGVEVVTGACDGGAGHPAG